MEEILSKPCVKRCAVIQVLLFYLESTGRVDVASFSSKRS